MQVLGDHMVLGGVTWFFGGITWFFGGITWFFGDHMVFGEDHMVFWGNGRRISHRQQSIKGGGEGGYRKFTTLIR